MVETLYSLSDQSIKRLANEDETELRPTLLISQLANGSDTIYLRYWDRIYSLKLLEEGVLELKL